VNGICKLCGANGPLIFSHIVPAFVIRWLKKTSATGYLRSLQSGERLQEGMREYLLCAGCEQRLGRHEKRFAEQIFLPYQKRPQPQTFAYEEWLRRFIVGLHWRVLALLPQSSSSVAQSCVAAEQEWRQYLLEQSPNPGTAEFHIHFVDVVAHTTFVLPKKFNWYMARSIDASPIYNEQGDVGVYVKLPRIITVSFIKLQNQRDHWQGTMLAANGTLTIPQQVSVPIFGQLLLERATLLDNARPMLTERQKVKIQRQAEAQPETILNSDSFRVHVADRNMNVERHHQSSFQIKGRDRNKPCPCGSGVKAKKCHGRLLRW
jgi:hypothetical protein